MQPAEDGSRCSIARLQHLKQELNGEVAAEVLRHNFDMQCHDSAMSSAGSVWLMRWVGWLTRWLGRAGRQVLCEAFFDSLDIDENGFVTRVRFESPGAL